MMMTSLKLQSGLWFAKHRSDIRAQRSAKVIGYKILIPYDPYDLYKLPYYLSDFLCLCDSYTGLDFFEQRLQILYENT